MSHRHCEEPPGLAFGEPEDRLRDEAIQSPRGTLDCFASLAMTTKYTLSSRASCDNATALARPTRDPYSPAGYVRNAGVTSSRRNLSRWSWIPACAGMTPKVWPARRPTLRMFEPRPSQPEHIQAPHSYRIPQKNRLIQPSRSDTLAA